MYEAYNLKSLKDMECLKCIIPEGYTILSNKKFWYGLKQSGCMWYNCFSKYF